MRFVNYELKRLNTAFPNQRQDYIDINSFLLDIDTKLVQEVLNDTIQYRQILTHNEYDIIIGHNYITDNSTERNIIERLTAYNILVINHESMQINLTLSHTIYIAHNFLNTTTIAFRAAFKHSYISDCYKTTNSYYDYNDDSDDTHTQSTQSDLTIHHIKTLNGYFHSVGYVNLMKTSTDMLEISLHISRDILSYGDNNHMVKLMCNVTVDGYLIQGIFPQDILNILEMLGTKEALSWKNILIDIHKPLTQLTDKQKKSISTFMDDEYMSLITNLMDGYGCDVHLYNTIGRFFHKFPFCINGHKDEYEYQCIASICADKLEALINNIPYHNTYTRYDEDKQTYKKLFTSDTGDVFVDINGSMYPFIKTRFGYIHTKNANRFNLISNASDMLISKAQKKLGATAKLSGKKVQEVITNMFKDGAK